MVAKRVSGRRAPHRDFVGPEALRHPQPPAAGLCKTTQKIARHSRGLCTARASWKASFPSPLTGISSGRGPSDIPARLRRSFANRHKNSAIEQARRAIFIPLCGEGGIRTPGTVIPYVSLANWWFKPLTHLTGHRSEYGNPNGTANIYLFRRTRKNSITSSRR